MLSTDQLQPGFANRKFVVVCICWNFFITNSTTKFPRKAPDINMLQANAVMTAFNSILESLGTFAQN